MATQKYLDLAKEIKTLIAVITKYARRDLEKRLADSGVKISFLGFGVLHHLTVREQTIKELSEKMMLAPATLVSVIDHLEAQKLIMRQVDKVDRRRTPLSLTAAGKKIIASAGLDKKLDTIANKLEELGPKKAQDLIDILHQLGAAIVGKEVLDDVLEKIKYNK